MSKIENNTQKLEARLKELSKNSDRSPCIKIIRNYLKNHDKTDGILLRLAFCLYHRAIAKCYLHSLDKYPKKLRNDMLEAIGICRKIIKKNKEDKTTTSARIYLAQIYSILHNKISIRMAKRNYERKPGALTSNRLADVYSRMEKYDDALFWYKKYEEMAEKENMPKFLYKTDMAIFYKKLGKIELANRYAEESFNSIPKNSKDGEMIRDSLIVYFPFIKERTDPVRGRFS